MSKKKKRNAVPRGILLVAFLLALSLSCFAQFEGGRGSEDDPWQIRTAEQLNNVRRYLGDEHRDKHFILIENIDLSERPFNEGWEPIGSEREGHFCGSFDGSRFSISNLIVQEEHEFTGLFGTIRGAKITNIGLKNVNVTGREHVGGLVGLVFGEGETAIKQCYVTGSVTAENVVGGLIGITRGPELSVEDCYSTADVRLRGTVAGGVIGLFEEGRVLNCYSIGAILSEQEPRESIGAVIGMAHGGGYRGLKFCPEFSRVDWAIGSRPDEFRRSSPEEMLTRENYEEYDFERTWYIVEGRSYPYLQWQGRDPEEHNIPGEQPPVPPQPPTNLRATAGNRVVNLSWTAPQGGDERPDGYNVYRDNRAINENLVVATEYRDADVTNFTRYSYEVSAVYGETETERTNAAVAIPFNFTGGDGTVDNPFHISTAEELDCVRHIHAHFIQTADIDLGVAPWNEGQGWAPIGGTDEDPFSGSFDGDGYVISNLTMSRASGYNGLFGIVNGTTFKNINLRDVRINLSKNDTGALAGHTAENSLVKNCSSTGEINIQALTDRHIGGLVGSVFNSRIVDSYSYINITGGERAGGVAGWLNGSHAENCYAAGNLNVGGVSGGFVGLIQRWGPGLNNGSITNCYARGSIEGTAQIGGFIGTVTVAGNIITNSYSTGRVIGGGGGFVGQGGNVSVNCYWDTETSQRDASQGGAQGRLTRQMVYPYDLDATFINWDFEEVWRQDSAAINGGYPHLYFQENDQVLLDAPVVKVEIIEHEGEKKAKLTWEAVENANSYSIYAAENYNDTNWGEPVAVIDEVSYLYPVGEARTKFFKVVASAN